MNQVYEPVLARMPDHVELRVYCPKDELTPTAIEDRILPLAEQAVGEPIRHTMRRTFPAPLKSSVAEEVESSWKSKSGVLLLSNKLSSPNHVFFNAQVSVRRGQDGALERFGVLSLHIHEKAPKLTAALERLRDFVRVTRAYFGRADSPTWISSIPVILPLSESWQMRERLGWLNYLPPSCSEKLPQGDETVRIEAFDHRGHIISLGSEHACAKASAPFAR